MIQVNETGRDFEVSFDYHPKIVSEIRAMNGRWWEEKKKVWHIPRSEQQALEILCAKHNKTAQTKQPEYYAEIPPLPELTIEIPLKRTMFPYQATGVAYSLEHKHVIIGDKPGLGKTTQAIATVVAAECKCILVICPSTLKLNWQREFDIVAGMKSIILSDKVKSTWQQYYKLNLCKVFIVNYESLRKYFVQQINTPKGEGFKLKHVVFKDTINLFDAVLIDESHRVKDGSTQQSKFCMGIAKNKEYVLELTGTPVVNKPKDLISQLHILDRLKEFGGYQYFMNRYCGGNGSGASNLKELNYKLCTTCFYQRDKKDVLKDLPDKMRQIILCEITNWEEYNAAQNDLASYLKLYREKTDTEVERSMRGELMVRIGVCKHIAARGKIREVVDHINEVLEAGEKLGVFIHHKEIAEALLKQYPHALTITGKDNNDQRQLNVDRFQNDPKCNLIICSIAAAGVGITLTAASRMCFVEQPWHPAGCDQCEDRFHRIGQKNSVQCTYFLGKDTIDEDIYATIEEKRGMSETVTGNADSTEKMIIDKITSSLFKNQTV